MTTTLVVIIAQPLVAIAVLFLIRMITGPLQRRMPDSKLKRFLFFSWRV